MKKFKFEIKEMLEDGSFTGIASMYGNLDLGGDIVEKGAFTKTLQEKSTVTILWQHETKSPIGLGTLEDTGNELLIAGQLNLEVEKGREAYALIKQKAVTGLSIGYDVIKHKYDKGARLLKELKLWEVSVVTFPMNTLSTIFNVKEDMKGLDLQTTMLEEESRHKLWKLQDLMDTTIRNIVSKDELDGEAKLRLIDATLSQFHALYMNSITFNIMNGIKMEICEEVKELEKLCGIGKKPRKKDMAVIQQCVELLNTMLQDESEDEMDMVEKSVKDNLEAKEVGLELIQEVKNINDIFNEMKEYLINREEI